MRRAAAAAVALVVLVGCSDEGARFDVSGTVTDAGNQSLKIELGHVYLDEAGWFDDDGVHRIHDNCDCHGFFNGHRTYGVVYDRVGNAIEPSLVAFGECVRLVGQIRSDQEGKYSHDRPVFDEARIVSCEAQ